MKAAAMASSTKLNSNSLTGGHRSKCVGTWLARERSARLNLLPGDSHTLGSNAKCPQLRVQLLVS